VRVVAFFREPHATLLAFGGSAVVDGGATLHVHAIALPGEPSARCDVFDVDGHAGRPYGAGAGTMVLVRPDGYVGVVTDVVADVEAYLRRIGPARPAAG